MGQHARIQTWAALIGHWVDFARAAVGLPADAEGRRVRDSVPDIIGLQAVWFALRDVDDLPDDERALGVDRAHVLVARHRDAIYERFGGHALPESLGKLIADAESALREAELRGRDPRDL